MNIYHDIGHLEYKLFIVSVIESKCIPQVNATHINQVLNTFYSLYSSKTRANLTV